MEIWIHINDTQQGPFAIDQLPVDQITPDTPVWHEGLPDWVYAKDVPAIAHLFAPEQEQLPSEPTEPAPEDKEGVSEPATDEEGVSEPATEEEGMSEPAPEPSPEEGLSEAAPEPTPEPKQPWMPQPPRQPLYQQPQYPPRPQYPPHPQYPYPPRQQYYPGPQGPWRPPYPGPGYPGPGPMHRPMPPRPMPAKDPAEASFAPKAPSMWLWFSIPLTIIFTGNLFGIIAIVLGIISRKKYKAGAYGSAIKLSRACEWLIMLGLTFGLAFIPLSMFL